MERSFSNDFCMISAMFCSKKCQEKATKEFHQIECNRVLFSLGKRGYPINGITKCLRLFEWKVDELEEFVKSIKQQPKTVFDFDFSDRDDPMYEKNMIRVMLSQYRGILTNQSFLVSRVIATTLSYVNKHPKLKILWHSRSELFEALLIKFFEVSRGAGSEVYFSKWINIDGCSPIDDMNKNTGTVLRSEVRKHWWSFFPIRRFAVAFLRFEQ
jgi:hypothetical protein